MLQDITTPWRNSKSCDIKLSTRSIHLLALAMYQISSSSLAKYPTVFQHPAPTTTEKL